MGGGGCTNACILEINENATLVFLISFQHGLVNQNFVSMRQLYSLHILSKVHPFYRLIVNMYCLKVLVQKQVI